MCYGVWVSLSVSTNLSVGSCFCVSVDLHVQLSSVWSVCRLVCATCTDRLSVCFFNYKFICPSVCLSDLCLLLRLSSLSVCLLTRLSFVFTAQLCVCVRACVRACVRVSLAFLKCVFGLFLGYPKRMAKPVGPKAKPKHWPSFSSYVGL